MIVNTSTCVLLFIVNTSTCVLLFIVNTSTCVLLFIVNTSTCVLLFIVNTSTCVLLVLNHNSCLLSFLVLFVCLFVCCFALPSSDQSLVVETIWNDNPACMYRFVSGFLITYCVYSSSWLHYASGSESELYLIL